MSHGDIETEQNNRRRAIDGMTRRLKKSGMDYQEARERSKKHARRRDIAEAEGRMKRRP